ncbi:MAG: hypothetical protein NT105_02910 [Verrucomicrobia bacterium]|nr:hypothetical protein [Verrucomicrobiota bacterium]
MTTMTSYTLRLTRYVFRFAHLFALAALVALAPGRASAEPTSSRELAFKQQHLRERYEDIEQQLARLSELLATSDPDGAARVQAALKTSRDGAVLSGLQEVIQSLLQSRTKTATESQTRVVQQLLRVLEMLQGQELSWEELQKRLANLQELRDALQKLIERQQKLEQQSTQAMKDVATGKAADPATLDKQKGEQAATRGDTEKTAGGAKQPGKFPPDTVDPGALDRAGAEMQKAEQALGDRKPGEANARQQQALDELQAAIGQIQSRLEAEKAAQQERTRSELKDGIKAMLEKQKTVTAATTALDKEIPPKKSPPREAALKAAGLAADEAALADRSEALNKKLRDDGTSAVFGQVLQQTAALLRDADTRLKKVQTGAPVQEAQKLAEMNLQELLEALQEEEARRAAAGAGGGGGGGMKKTMLLPPAAELKMLRMLQDRVNRGTRSLDEDRAGREKPTPQETAAAKQLSQREKEVVQTTDALRKKWAELSAPKPVVGPADPTATDPLKEYMAKALQDARNPLSPIVGDMRTVEDQLGQTVTGKPTQIVQTKIIRGLNDLIAKAQQAQSQATAMPQPRRKQPAKQPEASPQQAQGNKQPSSPATVSTLPAAAAAEAAKLRKIYGGGDSDAWGKLPPEQREKFLQTLKDKFPDRYEQILTEYFKQLSTSKPPTGMK